MTVRLGPKDWVDASLRVLARSGIEAVRVEPLAQALGVTKGSFYWHFKDRQALLDAVLDEWQKRATEAVIATVEAGGGDAHDRLERLFAIVSHSDGRLERAMLNWAALDPKAREALEAVAARRLAYLNAQFLALGFSSPEAMARARLCHDAVIGQFAMAEERDSEQRVRDRLTYVLPMLVRR